MGSQAGSGAELAFGARKVSKWSVPPQVFCTSTWNLSCKVYSFSRLTKVQQEQSLLFSGNTRAKLLMMICCEQAGCESTGCVVLHVEKENH